MPSQILHTLFGEDVTAGLYQRLKNTEGAHFGLLAGRVMEKIEKSYRGVFVLGCQGPDIFYHSQHRRPVALEYGSLLHRRGYGIFAAELLKMSLPDPPPDEDDIKNHRWEKGINALGVYALGFMTHAVLDRHCHPYIVYRAGRNHHAFFERILDVLMLQELRGQEAAVWDSNGILATVCSSPPLGLKEILARALATAFPDKVSHDHKLAQRIDNAFADCADFYELTAPAKTAITLDSSQGGLAVFGLHALSYVFPESLPAEIDFLNLQKTNWHYPYIAPGTQPKTDNRSFPEIYADALEFAINALAPCIIQYLDTGIFPISGAARNIGNTGLSILDEEAKPCAANSTEPFPLGDVLRQQGVLRGIK